MEAPFARGACSMGPLQPLQLEQHCSGRVLIGSLMTTVKRKIYYSPGLNGLGLSSQRQDFNGASDSPMSVLVRTPRTPRSPV